MYLHFLWISYSFLRLSRFSRAMATPFKSAVAQSLSLVRQLLRQHSYASPRPSHPERSRSLRPYTHRSMSSGPIPELLHKHLKPRRHGSFCQLELTHVSRPKASLFPSYASSRFPFSSSLTPRAQIFRSLFRRQQPASSHPRPPGPAGEPKG